jgi:hypothetical protein
MAHGGDGEREMLAAALDAVVDAIGVAHDRLRLASPATRALIAEHASWPENFLWTDGSQVAKAARRIADLLRRNPAPLEPPTPARRRRASRDR